MRKQVGLESISAVYNIRPKITVASKHKLLTVEQYVLFETGLIIPLETLLTFWTTEALLGTMMMGTQLLFKLGELLMVRNTTLAQVI
ncbi:hypothetical protein [Paenibacillus sp. OK060]|uniref:hypothetical protein n=1 Tax=Paenibacillus sp. OK060 TaxID=1881034 RepID=UPI0015A37584|nr:hypothetical protein [Paenibacillus sp. OK060]